MNTALEGKTTALVSYITIIVSIIDIFMNIESKNEFARFHIRQAFGIHILFYSLGILVTYFDSWLASMGFYIFVTRLWIYGFIAAVQLRKATVPLIGTHFQKWFTFIQ